MADVLPGVVFATLLVTACVFDARARRIPNLLVLLLAGIGLSLSVLGAPGLPAPLRATEGLVLGIAVWLPFHLFGMLGAGDVKFFGAAATWLGPASALSAATLTGLCGGVLAVVWLARSAWRRGQAPSAPGSAIARAESMASVHPAVRLPYGIAMAVGLGVSAWAGGILR